MQPFNTHANDQMQCWDHLFQLHPVALMSCAWYILLDHREQIVRLERVNGRSEANMFLAKKMLESDNTGWFTEFISALQSAGKCSVFV